MEVSGVVFNYHACVSCSGSRWESAPSSLSAGLAVGRRSLVSGFSDNGHLKYYYSDKKSCDSGGNRVCMAAVRDEKSTKTEKAAPLKMAKKKKHMKFLKSLSRDLSTFSQMGFGLDLHPDHELLHRVKGNTFSEASEILQKRLQELKTEKDMNRQRKKEKKQQKAAARMKNRLLSGKMSSSSSSESSDSDCQDVVEAKYLRMAAPKQDSSKPVAVEDAVTLTPPPAGPALASNQIEPHSPVPDDLRCHSLGGDTNGAAATIIPAGKVEVCMGGKCKKSGAVALYEEFQRAVGVEGAVTWCKCMGKCRDGPNVRVVSSDRDSCDRNQLRISVGLDDVKMIVANFLGEERNRMRLDPSV